MTTPFVDNKNGHCRLCVMPDDEDDMIACDECDRWFHIKCTKLKIKPGVDTPWICIKCTTDRIKYASKSAENVTMLELVKALQQTTLQGQTQLKRSTLLNLPYFDGKSRDWPKFKQAFDETTREAQFSSLENLNRLQRFLKGDAERAVRSLFLDPDNIPKILERLEEQFGRPDQVYQEMLKDVLRIKIDNQFKIPELSDALENLITNMKVLNKSEYFRDQRLINELVSKFSTDKQIRWLEHKTEVEKDNRVVTLEDLSDWLVPWARNLRQLVNKSDRTRNPINFHRDFKNQRKGNVRTAAPIVENIEVASKTVRNSRDYTADNNKTLQGQSKSVINNRHESTNDRAFSKQKPPPTAKRSSKHPAVSAKFEKQQQHASVCPNETKNARSTTIHYVNSARKVPIEE